MASTHSYPACRNSEISEPCSLCCYIPRAALRVSYHGLCTGACGFVKLPTCNIRSSQSQSTVNPSVMNHGCGTAAFFLNWKNQFCALYSCNGMRRTPLQVLSLWCVPCNQACAVGLWPSVIGHRTLRCGFNQALCAPEPCMWFGPVTPVCVPCCWRNHVYALHGHAKKHLSWHRLNLRRMP